MTHKYKRQMSRLGVIIMAAFLCAFFVAGTASAREGMTAKASVKTGWQRDANFHRHPTAEKEVDTYFIKPGIELGYVTPKSEISLDYWFKYHDYDDQDENVAGLDPDEYDFTEHSLRLGAHTRPTSRVIVGVHNLYMKTRNQPYQDVVSNSVDRLKFDMNKFSPWLNYRFGKKFGLGLKYTNFITDYSDDDLGEDSDENRGTFNLSYHLNSRTSFDLDYQYWTRDYDKTTSDYDSSQVMFNLNHQLHYLTLSAGVGYHSRDFDQSVPSGDIDTFAWKLSVLGQNPPEAEGIPKSSIYLGLSSNFNDSGSGDNYYEALRLDAKLTHLFLGKFNCTLAGWYQNSDYETSDRDDDRWLASAAVDYLINEYFAIGVEGGTEERDSNLSAYDYDNNYVMFNLSFNYDFGSR